MSKTIYRAGEEEDFGTGQVYWVDARLPTDDQLKALIRGHGEIPSTKREGWCGPMYKPFTRSLILLKLELNDLQLRLANQMEPNFHMSGVLLITPQTGRVYRGVERIDDKLRERSRDPALHSYVPWFSFRTKRERDAFDGEKHLKELFGRAGYQLSLDEPSDKDYEEQVSDLLQDLILPFEIPHAATEFMLHYAGFDVDVGGDFV